MNGAKAHGVFGFTLMAAIGFSIASAGESFHSCTAMAVPLDTPENYVGKWDPYALQLPGTGDFNPADVAVKFI